MSDGVIQTVAGGCLVSSIGCSSADGAAATSYGLEIVDLAFDSSNNIIFTGSCKVRKVSANTGVLTTLAGNSNCYIDAGDGGAATSAQLATPRGVAIDTSDNIYIATNYRIRKITHATGVISTIVGIGSRTVDNYDVTKGDGGSVTSAEVIPIGDIVINSQGDVYFGDAGGLRVVTTDGCKSGYYSSTGSAVAQIYGSLGCSECPSGQYSGGQATVCSPCIPGYSSDTVGAITCANKCGNGYYPYGHVNIYCPRYGCTQCQSCGKTEKYVDPFTECEACPYPSIQGSIASQVMDENQGAFSYCNYYSWDAPESLSLSIALIGAAMYLGGVLYLRGKNGDFDLHASGGLFVYTVIPALDTITDLQYVLTATFATRDIFIAVMAFYFIPMMFFFYHLYDVGDLAPGWLMKACHALEKACGVIFVFEKYDNVIKIIVTFLLGLPCFIIVSPLVVPWAVFGIFLYMTKLFANKAIQDFWLSVWTGEAVKPSGEMVDKKVLNESIFSEIVFESLPELILQSLNNQLLGEWNIVGYISAANSALSVANGVYRVLYFKFYLKQNLVDVEVDLYLISGKDETLKDHKEIEMTSTRDALAEKLRDLADEIAPMSKNDIVKRMKLLLDDSQKLLDHEIDKTEEEESANIDAAADKTDTLISWLGFAV